MFDSYREHCEHEEGAQYDYHSELWASERKAMEAEAQMAEYEAEENQKDWEAGCPAHVEAYYAHEMESWTPGDYADDPEPSYLFDEPTGPAF